MCCNFVRNHRRLTIVCGCLLAIAGILLLSLTSTMIKGIVKSKLVLKEGSYTYDFWKSLPIPMYYSVYMFNLTNPDGVLKGDDPFLKEVGPYVYRVQMDKTNITFNSNGTVSYKQMRTFHYMPEKSGKGLSLKDMITHLNMVVISAYSFISKMKDPGDGNKFMYYLIEAACKEKTKVDCSLFLKHNVSDLLFEGYHDEIIKELKEAPKGFQIPIPFSKFGFFVGRNATPGADGAFNTYTGVNDINKLGYLAKWNNIDHLGSYKPKSVCDRFDYSSAGDFRPPYLLTENSDPIYMFIGDVARSIRMDYHQEVEFKNIKGKRYTADQHLFDYSLEENQCYCMNINGKLKCPDNGVANVSASAFGAPVFISHPHFLYANKSYLDHIKGLTPVESKHGFYFDIEPSLAVPLRANARIQINVLIEKVNYENSLLKNLPFERLLLPVLWTGISIELDDDMSGKLKLVLKTLPLILYILSSVLLLSGILLLVSAFYFKKDSFGKK